ncbi:hypothetical protein ACPCHQ_21745 [Ralstonia thomasii]|uniref:hypothetical protein n=1 Tax=Ralstonia thomasii TaxID=3058596 RepID=UPI003C2C1C2E
MKKYDPGLGLRPRSQREKLIAWFRNYWFAAAILTVLIGYLTYGAIDAQLDPFIRHFIR